MRVVFMPPETLIHVGFGLSALAFLVRDILWLRLLAITSYTLFVTFQLSRAGGPIWQVVGWYAVFITINVGHAAYLIYERRLQRLSPEEDGLRRLAFPAVDPVAVRRLFRKGSWVDLPAGEFLTHEGRVARDLFLIYRGGVTVEVGDAPIAHLGPGRFVGEIALLTGSVASATTRVAGEPPGHVRCIAWNQRRLRQRLERDDTLRTTLYAAIGADLCGKVADDNVKVRRSRMGAAA